jgi:NinB protein
VTQRMTATLFNAAQGHAAYTALWKQAKALLTAGHKLHVTIKAETRSLSQNSKMWAMLADVSAQVVWHGNKLTPEEWKTMFTASLKKQRVLPGLDGGFVVMGDSTSKMTIAEMSELIELMTAFAVERDVFFRAPEELPA